MIPNKPSCPLEIKRVDKRMHIKLKNNNDCLIRPRLSHGYDMDIVHMYMHLSLQICKIDCKFVFLRAELYSQNFPLMVGVRCQF